MTKRYREKNNRFGFADFCSNAWAMTEDALQIFFIELVRIIIVFSNVKILDCSFIILAPYCIYRTEQ